MLVILQSLAPTRLFLSQISNAIVKKMARRLAWELVIRIMNSIIPGIIEERGLKMKVKRLEAQKHWCRLQGFELIPKVVTGALFVDGEKQTQQAAYVRSYPQDDEVVELLIQGLTERGNIFYPLVPM
jgi:hypothetical protein